MKHHSLFAEALEARRLLAGITLVAPAWDGGLTGWLDSTINAITADLGGKQNVPQYVLTIAPNSNGTLAVQGATHVAGTATPQANSPGQIIVTLDYTSVSTNSNYPLSEIGSLIANFMENTPVDGVYWASLPVHEISMSRGTGLMDAISQSLDESGIWVDQETYLDPHPVTFAPYNDPNNTVYDNVEFADDYWRTSNNPNDPYPSGHPIDGAYNLELPWVEADYSGFAIAHLAPSAYYIGTIDPALIGSSDGDGPIHADWYGNGSTPSTFPSATQTGFLYSSIDGGTRPLSGVWAASGGSGVRTSVAHTGLQWPNISDVASISGSTIQTGGTLDVQYIHQDQSEADTITFYLDSDQNPFDGAGYDIGSAAGVAPSSSINSAAFAASLAGVAPGTYYLGASVTDSSGLDRYDYGTQKIVISAAPSGPIVSASPTSASVTAGSAVTFTASATGSPTPTVQWEISTNGGSTFTNIAGATSTTYSFTAATSENGDEYQAVFTNSANTAVTAPATLAVTAAASGSLSGVQSTAAASYNLTALGTSDWAHWGLGGNASAFDHKATGGSQISNVTRLGAGGYGGYADPSRDVTWSDGSPVAKDTGDSGYIWANNAIGAGYSFTVPASTTTQTLYVYLGGYSSGSTLTAHLSGGSIADYVANFSGSGLYADIVAITYSAASAGQTLKISYVKSQTISYAGGSTDLIAAWLVGGAVASTAPSVQSGPTSQSVAAGSTVTFTASATGNPTPAVQWQISTNGGSSFANISGATSLAYSFTTAASENGDEYRAVFTNALNSATTAAATLTVTAPSSTGSITGVQSTAASSYNLTTLGTSDWAHWGLGGNGSAFDHKATGNSQISNVTRLGAGGYGGYADPSRDVTWTDGSPVAKDTGDSGYIWANNAIGAGYSFTVPASTTARTLYVYLGGYSSGSTLTAQLSDGSAANYVANLSGSGLYADIIAITYKAGSAGQTLKISYVKSQTINGAGGSSDLIAAWLA